MTDAARFVTKPYYAQVAIFDPSVPDSYPDWGDGLAEFVTARHGAAVATRADDVGDVEVAVVLGPDQPDGRVVVTGELIAASGRLQVGSVTGNDLREVFMSPGAHRMSICLGGPPGAVDIVTFWFPDGA